MIKKIISISMALFLASCGNSKISGVNTETRSETSSSRQIVLPAVTMESVLSQAEKGRYKDGELLVKFKSGVSSRSALSAHQASGASVVRRFSIVENLEHVKLPKGLSVKDAISRYMADPSVEYAEPNYKKCLSSTVPNDLYFNPQQWALNNTGTYASGTAGADMKMPLSWDITTGNANLIIAVLDTGIDYNHPDLVNNIWKNSGETCSDGIDHDRNGFANDCRGWDFANSDNDPMDDNGHGTHVAGIIGAVGNNGTGVSGVMWNVKLMPLKIFDATGLVDDTQCGGTTGFTADEVAGIQYAVAKGAKVINASFGGPDFCNTEFSAIASANAAGVLFVASSGNAGTNNDLAPEYPASYSLPNIISVATTDQNDRRAVFSNFGLQTVHVAAPGVYILSTITPGLTFSLCTGAPFPGYDICSGTSMSAPHVSGLAGLLWSYYANFNYAQIRSTILRYVDVLPDLTGWIQTGGRINAYKALSSLLTPTNLQVSGATSSSISLSWTDNATGEDGYKIERKKSTGGTYVQIAVVGSNSTTFTDSGLSPSTGYTYRVRAYNTIPADSFYSNEISATTPAASADAGGGGGGCSIGARQNMPTTMADAALIVLPLVAVALMRRKR